MIGQTGAELIVSVRGELSEGDEEFFTDANVLDFISRGQDVIATRLPWACIAMFSTQTVANQPSYLLPLELLHPTATYLKDANGVPDRLNFTEPDLMDGASWHGMAVSGRWGSCTYRRTDSAMEVQVLPTPTVTGRWLDVVGHVRPTPMTATTDRTSLDPVARHVLVNYALWKCKSKDEESPQGDRYRQDFETSLSDLEARKIIKQFDQFNRTRGQRPINRRMYGRW